MCIVPIGLFKHRSASCFFFCQRATSNVFIVRLCKALFTYSITTLYLGKSNVQRTFQSRKEVRTVVGGIVVLGALKTDTGEEGYGVLTRAVVHAHAFSQNIHLKSKTKGTLVFGLQTLVCRLQEIQPQIYL